MNPLFQYGFHYDERAGVYITTSNEVPGLCVEAETEDALSRQVSMADYDLRMNLLELDPPRQMTLSGWEVQMYERLTEAGFVRVRRGMGNYDLWRRGEETITVPVPVRSPMTAAAVVSHTWEVGWE